MKYRSKQQRLIAIVKAYQEKFQKQAITLEEVSNWAVECGLWPVPRRSDPKEACADWEQRLCAASNSVSPNCPEP